jgi:hypothetical protein
MPGQIKVAMRVFCHYEKEVLILDLLARVCTDSRIWLSAIRIKFCFSGNGKKCTYVAITEQY